MRQPIDNARKSGGKGHLAVNRSLHRRGVGGGVLHSVG